ncbi:hypothetical protein EZV62_009149 [Acer yangbiense]|uniref:3'-5' exonuclease domain-containing protein n=1 Tax=Acer yangbiense TaxID=1000413 RepID=A0A5C7IFV3_9ROSI|nr:hypothetical protein EZV62_009149 [Acer yangbiense]
MTNTHEIKMEDGIMVKTEVLCNGVGCVLINLDQQDTNHTSYLNNLLANDDVIFAGVHLKERLKQLRKTYGFEIKNAVDLSVMAASVLHQPRFGAYGVRHCECATVDAYAAYKIAKRLLSEEIVP